MKTAVERARKIYEKEIRAAEKKYEDDPKALERFAFGWPSKKGRLRSAARPRYLFRSLISSLEFKGEESNQSIVFVETESPVLQSIREFS